MVAITASILVFLLVMAAESIHARRVKRVAQLAFGPKGKASSLGQVLPWLRPVAAGLLAWGLITLISIQPKVYQPDTVNEEDIRHVVLVLDVSPSMRLEDAGPEKTTSRRKRAGELMQSFFKRVIMEQVRLSVVAVYTGAKPVVVDTRDVEVARNILNDLPMSQAFDPGKTQLFSGLEEAAKIAKKWRKNSTTIVVLSDGDTVPTSGLPQMPPSVSDVLVIGVGDPRTGSFINGYQSKQEASTLRQLATRLRGVYHDGNTRHISSDVLERMTQASSTDPFKGLTKREYALIASGLGSFGLAAIPWLLAIGGTRWKPGVRNPL
ncbi:MAG: VWA domain-containing protein [Verrucomicrobia bacterium]|jgi:Ca-activated chloride channel homolog|nr:VWA domain-containing protein [Verrucomicrobiota bacterium]